MNGEILITKRDGRTEKFDPDKIKRVVMAAGLNEADAASLSQDVATWLKQNTDGMISTLRIRDQVLSRLRGLDSYAAGLYEWYEKTKDKK